MVSICLKCMYVRNACTSEPGCSKRRTTLRHSGGQNIAEYRTYDFQASVHKNIFWYSEHACDFCQCAGLRT